MSAMDRIQALFEDDPALELTARQIALKLNVKPVTVSLHLLNLHEAGVLDRRRDVGHHRGGARRFVYRKAAR